MLVINQQSPTFGARIKMKPQKIGEYLNKTGVKPERLILGGLATTGGAAAVSTIKPDLIAAPDAAKYGLLGGLAALTGGIYPFIRHKGSKNQETNIQEPTVRKRANPVVMLSLGSALGLGGALAISPVLRENINHKKQELSEAKREYKTKKQELMEVTQELMEANKKLKKARSQQEKQEKVNNTTVQNQDNSTKVYIKNNEALNSLYIKIKESVSMPQYGVPAHMSLEERMLECSKIQRYLQNNFSISSRINEKTGMIVVTEGINTSSIDNGLVLDFIEGIEGSAKICTSPLNNLRYVDKNLSIGSVSLPQLIAVGKDLDVREEASVNLVSLKLVGEDLTIHEKSYCDSPRLKLVGDDLDVQFKGAIMCKSLKNVGGTIKLNKHASVNRYFFANVNCAKYRTYSMSKSDRLHAGLTPLVSLLGTASGVASAKTA